MLIDDENIRVQYDSTAESPIMAGDALPFPFRFIEKEQVKAILLDGTKLIFNEDYTVGLEEEEEEKPEGEDEASVSSDYTSVILNIDIPIGETITLYRETDLDQTSEFPQEARFSSRKIEDALDKLTMQNQEQREALGRAMKLPLTAAVDLKDLALPNPEPNKSVKWNSEGTALVNTSFDPDTALVTTENFKKQAEQSAKDSANSAAASANSATVAGQKVNEITALHSDYMDDINTTSTNYLNQINSRGNTIIKDADAIINRVGLNLFDTVVKDYALTYPDGQGLALQGTWVYRDAKAGERYGYPDFYNRCVKEFKESTTASENNVTVTGTITNKNGVISGFSAENYATVPAVPTNVSSYEIGCKFTVGVLNDTQQGILANSTTNICTPQFCVTAANKLNFNHPLSSTEWTGGSSVVIEAGKTYWVKAVWKNFVVTSYYKTANSDWQQIASVEAETLNWTEALGIGIDTKSLPFSGSIDLNECYININGSRWWDGVRLRRHSNGHYYYPISAKATIDSRFNTNGAAWYYGVDEANKRIFLPRNNWFMQMASSGAGNFTDAGIPDHTHTITMNRTKKSGTDTATVWSYSENQSGTGTVTSNKASASNSVYGKSSTVQPKSVKHLLYICVGNQVQTDSWVDTITQVKNGAKEIDDSVQGAIADVEEAKDACIAEIGTTTAELTRKMAFSMFDTILKDHKLSYPYDQGFALQGTYVYHDADPGTRYGYPDFYNTCVKERDEAAAKGVQQITLGGTTISMYIHDNGHMYYDISIKSSIDTWFNTFGTAWFYGVDKENKRIFLPRNNWFEQGASAVSDIGKTVDAGLPNIKGTAGTASLTKKASTSTATTSEANMSGSFYCISAHNSSTLGTSSGWFMNAAYAFDASRSSAVYGKSSTVQPRAVKKLLYICVGNRVQDLSWINIVDQVNNGVKDIDDAYQKAMSTLQAVGPVLQTGSTMTGQLAINKGGTHMTLTASTFDFDVVPSTTEYCGFQFNDKNGRRFGKLEGHYHTDGTLKFGLNSMRTIDGTNYYAGLLTWVDTNGLPRFTFPQCTTKATTTSSASSDRVAVVVQNYVSGASWYRVWSDGWKEQGGRTAAKESSGYAITFLKAFADTNYTILFTDHYTGSSGNGWGYAHTRTATGCKFVQTSAGGNWYACGY